MSKLRVSASAISLAIIAMRIGGLVAKFGLTIFIARFLGMEDLGRYGLIAGLVAIVPVFVSFGFGQSLAREAAHKSLEAVVQSIARYGIVVFPVYAIMLAAGLSIDFYQRQIIYSLIAVVLLLEHFNNDLFNLLLARGQPIAGNVLVFLRSAIWIYAYVFFALFNQGLRSISVLLGSWVAGLIVTTFCGLYCVRKWPWHGVSVGVCDSYAWAIKYQRGSRYIYLSELASNIGFYADRYLIAYFMGVNETGVYTLFSSIGMALYNLVSSGVMQVARPAMVRAYAGNDFAGFEDLYVKCFKRAVVSALVLLVVSGAVFPYFAPYVKQPEVLARYNIFVLVLLGVLIRVIADVEGYRLYTARLDIAFMQSTFISVVVALVVNFVLIKDFGLLGAVMSGWLAYLSAFVFRRWCANKMSPNTRL